MSDQDEQESEHSVDLVEREKSLEDDDEESEDEEDDSLWGQPALGTIAANDSTELTEDGIVDLTNDGPSPPSTIADDSFDAPLTEEMLRFNRLIRGAGPRGTADPTPATDKAAPSIGMPLYN